MESVLVLLFAVCNSHGLPSLLEERPGFTQQNGFIKLLLQTRHATKSGGEVENEGKLSLPPPVNTFNLQPGDPDHMASPLCSVHRMFDHEDNVSDNRTTEISGLYNPAASESMLNTSLSFSLFETPAKIFSTAINEMIVFAGHAGSLTLGGIDVGKYYGPMNHVRLLEDQTHQHSTSYCVSLAKLQILVSDSDSMVDVANDDRPAYFNTRNRLTRFPAEAFDVILGIFDPYSLPKAGRDGEVLYSLPCSFDGAEYIRFGFGGAGDFPAFDIDVAIEDLILDPVTDAESPGACLLGISRGDAGTDFILGETFLAAVTDWQPAEFGSLTASPSDVAIPTIFPPSIAVSSEDSWNTLSDATYDFSSTSSGFLKNSVSHDNLTTTITVRRTRNITVNEAPDSIQAEPSLLVSPIVQDSEVAFETNAPGIVRTGLIIASSSANLAGPGAGGDKTNRLRPDVSSAVGEEEFR
ncbi:predicted protein [Verticillium alfalfae VaMs.102]|uniref:Predicted protein n=1 Tax=Verticillium alfalfae (strain VaMs.102 / ATCC MYA-4576 / FGSC 10136) TaxID=526221 RepID=C9SCL5_VERA1|nr:predicted protein [Verticillium alfalfae VaMs.102]EEY16830.1 predicted protein [Verticillium alfalfae VaMs.102]